MSVTTTPRFAYFEHASSLWPSMLAEVSQAGSRRIQVPILWGVHESIRGVRDFSRTRLRLEKLLHLAQQAGLEVEVSLGFPAQTDLAPKSIPDWVFGSDMQATQVPAGLWKNRPYGGWLAHIPSLWDPEFQNAYLGFVNELLGILSLYKSPEGPLVRVELDWGVFRQDQGACLTQGYEEQLKSLFPSLDSLNIRYRTTFRSYESLVSYQGTRVLFDKRAWHAAYDYKLCRSGMLASLEEKTRALPNAAELRGRLKFLSPVGTAQASTAPWAVMVDTVLLESDGGDRCFPMAPLGILPFASVSTFRLWEYLHAQGALNGISVQPFQKGSDLNRTLVVFAAGRFFSREDAVRVQKWVQSGGQAFFPLGFPQFDEALAPFDWAAGSSKQKVRCGGFYFYQRVMGKGSFWSPISALTPSEAFWEEMRKRCESILAEVQH